MGQRHVCTFRHALRAAYRTAISAAQILVTCNSAMQLVEIESRDYNVTLPCPSMADWRGNRGQKYFYNTDAAQIHTHVFSALNSKIQSSF